VRWSRPLTVALAVAVVAAVLAAAWLASVRVELAAPTGPHAVGRAHGAFGEERKVPYTLYYPAQAGTGSHGPYVPASIADELGRRDLGPFRLLPDAWGRVHHAARDGAAWAQGPFPLLLFSPGADVQPEYYSSLLAELASHGFVVAALAHPGITPFVAYPDGTWTRSPEPEMPRGEAAAVAAHEARIDAVAGDVLAALAAIPAQPMLAGRLDGRVGAFGHSLGGAGAAEAAAREPLLAAVADLDGSLGNEARGATLARPVLFMQDEGFVPAPDAAARQAFVASGSPGRMEVLAGASHTTFITDGNWFEEARPFGGDADRLGAEEAWRAVSAPLLSFFAEAFPAP
jgi:dienelactone hydrolase